jgi:hypothetical protein
MKIKNLTGMQVCETAYSMRKINKCLKPKTEYGKEQYNNMLNNRIEKGKKNGKR